MHIKIKKKAKPTYHNEHCWKYLQLSYMKNYHHHRFHICPSLPSNSKRDHSLLATKNNKNKKALCHSAQWKTMKISNVSFPLPQNIVVQCVYLVFLGNSLKAISGFGFCNVRAKYMVQSQYTTYSQELHKNT